MRHLKNLNYLSAFILVFFFCTAAGAQNKYAVLLAVDEYYEAPRVKSSSSLSGCVNDANSVKGLLVNRFGFDEKNIFTLYNVSATKKNFFDAMRKTYQKCKAGDAVVFYYSGHGVWMSNGLLQDDTVKRGMSQAIVMSDLYASGWDCLVSDETLKNIFNQFINKKIILTSIFDCCYSGNIPMPPPPPQMWTVLPPEGRTVKQIEGLPYTPKEKKPTGCPEQSKAKSPDSDHDGVPDCRDWEVNSLPGSEVDSMGVCRNPDPEGFITSPFNQYTAADFQNDSVTNASGEMDRSFNLSSAITTSWRSSVRPSDRKNSRFLSLSACDDNEKALEITDMTGKKHGAFTAALLSVYRNSRPDISARELIKKLRTGMFNQAYYQTPNFHQDPQRLNGNLIGITNSGFSDRIRATVKMIKGGQITINKGLNDGITKGNVLRDAGPQGQQKIRIINVSDNEATAMDSSNGKIKSGDVFELTDDYTVSDPLLKIYIPSFAFEPSSFESFFKTNILPFTGSDQRRQDFTESRLTTWDAANKFQKIPVFNVRFDNSNALLPMPSYIADSIRAALNKDQNCEIVNDINKANVVLYFSYAGQNQNGKSKFEMFFHTPFNGGFFAPFNVKKLSSINPPTKEIHSLSLQLLGDLKQLLRVSTNRWMNTYPRR